MTDHYQAVANRPLYRGELDGIRSICILLTIANHLPGTPYFIDGTVGVDIFFALSGWLITTLICNEYFQNKTISVKSFYTRRFFRIVPLYILTMILYLAASLVMVAIFNSHSDLNDFIVALPSLLTFNGEYRPEEAGNIFGHAWTLGIEEKFYLIVPVLFMIAATDKKKYAFLTVPVVVILFLIANNKGFILRGYLGLGFGALIALWVNRMGERHILIGAFRAGGGLFVLVVSYILGRIWPHEFLWNIMISFCAAIVIANIWFDKAPVLKTLLSLRPLPALGKLTYAVYLTHVLVINVVLLVLAKSGVTLPYALTFLAAYLFAVALAVVLHHGVEKPFINIGRSLSRRYDVRAERILQAA